jgi:methionyl-tRNA formyltransferase
MRIVFAGTPDIAATVLRALLQTEHEVVAVYTQPDRPAGRARQLKASPVKMVALDQGIPIEQPSSLKEPQAQARLAHYQCDLMVVVAYGLLLPQAVLDIPRLGCWNVHVSLLPRWRGAAPIQRAIEAGDQQTGVSIMQMDAGLDTGPILLQVACDIMPEDTGGSLHERLADLGAQALLQTLQRLAQGALKPMTQPEYGVTYAHKLSKAQAVLDWRCDAVVLARQVRAYNPWPVSVSQINRQTVRIWQAQALPESHEYAPGVIVAVQADGIDVACGDGILRLTHCQLPGKKVLTARDIVNQHGHPFVIGVQFDVPAGD